MEPLHGQGIKSTGICATDGCGKSIKVRKWCENCYHNHYRAGDLDPLPTERERFYSRTYPSDHPHPTLGTPCLLWRGGTKRCNYGYGSFSVNGFLMTAHRAAWTLERGSVPDGIFVLHKCDNPPCVNVEHLFLGTHDDNMKDMAAKGRGVGGISLGEKHGNAVLTEEKVREIRSLNDQGISYKKIGEMFGVAFGHVGQIVRRESWKHVV